VIICYLNIFFKKMCSSSVKVDENAKII